MRCGVCSSINLLTFRISDEEGIIFCFQCFCLSYLNNQREYLDHDPNFKVEDYIRGINWDSERRNYVEILENLKTYLPSNLAAPKLHDIGCGTGNFMSEAMRYGYEVSGNDIWREMIEFCRPIHGMDVYLGNFDPSKHEGLSAITYLCVIAHMNDPWDSVNSASKSLKKGGVVYIHTPRLCLIDVIAIASFILSFKKYKTLLKRRVNNSHRVIYSKKGLYIGVRQTSLNIESMKPKIGYGLAYANYFQSLGMPKLISNSIDKSLRFTFLKYFLPRNRWIMFLRKVN